MSRPPTTPQALIAVAKQMWIAQHRIEDIADKVGVSVITIKQWRFRYEWPPRHRPPSTPIKAAQRASRMRFALRRCTYCGQLTPGSDRCQWCKKAWDAPRDA